MKQCSIAVKITELFGMLPRCVLKFVTFARFLRPVLATFCMGNFIYMFMNDLKKKKDYQIKRNIYKQMHHRTNFEADLWPETRLFLVLN